MDQYFSFLEYSNLINQIKGKRIKGKLIDFEKLHSIKDRKVG